MDLTPIAERPCEDCSPYVLAGATSQVISGVVDAPGMLSTAERDRAAAIRSSAARADFVAAHVLARVCAARLLDVPPAAVAIGQHCDLCGGAHGRPYVSGVPDVHVAWSHTRGYVAAGASRTPIGVDVEVLRHDELPDGFVDRAFTAAEARTARATSHPQRSMLLHWSRKECLVKLGLATLDTAGPIEFAGLSAEPQDRPASWRPWRDGLQVVDWWDGARNAVGAAVTQEISETARSD